jgi:WD40 repeat protein
VEDEDFAPVPGTRRLGDYELGELIARGGMGAVYRARQVSLDRVVALKILSPTGTEGPDFLERFRIEAAAAASLVHPNIVSVYGFGQQDGEFFLAMQYVSGGSLRHDETAKDRLSPKAAAALVAKVARAVHHAHQRGILHRDLKPGNILMGENGEPILADFGLAKIMGSDAAITVSSALLGTPAYMAPEQARGGAREITVAADVYGLGAVLYDLLTGRPPVWGATALETLRAVEEQEPVRPSLVNSAVDRDLETICLKSLEKDPARRYASAVALADDLQCWLEQRPIQARPSTTWERTQKWLRQHRTLVAMSLLAIAGLLGVMIVSLWMNFRLTKAHRLIVAQAEERRQALLALQVATGNRLAEQGDPLAALPYFAEAVRLEVDHPDRAWADRERFALAMADVPALRHEFFHPAAVASVGFDPQGTRLVTACADGAVRLWDVEKGTLLSVLVKKVDPLSWAGFSPDGRWVAVRSQRGVVTLYDAKTGERVSRSWEGPLVRGFRDDRARHPAFSSDGRWFAIPRAFDLILYDLSATPASWRVVPTPSAVTDAFFSPKDRKLALTFENGGAQILELPDLQIVQGFSLGGTWRNGAWSPDGNRFALMSSSFLGQIFDVSNGSTAGRAALKHLDAVKGCSFSPDGERLLTWSYDGYARLFESSTGNLSASPLSHDGPLTAAAFSPNGRNIATASVDGFVRLFTTDPLQSVGVRLPLGSPVLDVAYSPRGDRLAAAGANGRVRVWDAPDHDLSFRHWDCDGPVNSVAFSPGGARLATVELKTTAQVWDVESGRAVCAPLEHPARALEIGWLDETHLCTTCMDHQFRIWKIPEGTVEKILPMPGEIKGHLSGHLLEVYFRGKDCELWDAATGHRQTVLGDTADKFIKLNADRSLYVAARNDVANVGTVTAPQRILLRHQLDRESAFGTVDTAGQRMAIAYTDFSMEIFAVPDGQRLAGPLRHRSGVRDMAFTPDGRILASASDDGTMRLWEAATGEPLSPPLWHGNRVIRIDIRRDGRAVATASSDGFARIWRIPRVPEDAGELKRLAQWLNAVGD